MQVGDVQLAAGTRGPSSMGTPVGRPWEIPTCPQPPSTGSLRTFTCILEAIRAPTLLPRPFLLQHVDVSPHTNTSSHAALTGGSPEPPSAPSFISWRCYRSAMNKQGCRALCLAHSSLLFISASPAQSLINQPKLPRYLHACACALAHLRLAVQPVPPLETSPRTRGFCAVRRSKRGSWPVW